MLDAIECAARKNCTLDPEMDAKADVPRPGILAAIGLGALFIYACVGLLTIPLRPMTPDSENFSHWSSADFEYASSPIDISVISPFQGLGGLVQPLGVWLNPAHLAAHFLPAQDPRHWSFLVGMLLVAIATFLLGHAMGLPAHLAVLCGQVMAIAVFPPAAYRTADLGHLNLTSLYVICSPPIAFVTALGTALLAVVAYLGTSSRALNVACAILLPCLVVYSVLCDPLYTTMFFIPVAIFAAGIFVGSGSKSVFLWRTYSVAACLLVCLAINLPGFYRALTAYAARAAFPNELYVEVQRWDYLTNLIFQHGLATLAALIVIGASGVVCWFGATQMRGFALSILGFQFLMIVISFAYVYSGIRWSLPLPVYFEYGALPSYIVVSVLGLWIGYKKLAPRFSGSLLRPLAPRLSSAVVVCSVLALPAFGAIGLGAVSALRHPVSAATVEPNRSAGDSARTIRSILVRELAMGSDGFFRGSVATVVGVPASVPYAKENIDFVWGKHLRTFDRDFYLSGFWNLRIPTLEDNNHLVTPPFHFLVSRALSRPQDYHSRNWALITKTNPKLMAGLGCRFLLTDSQQSDPLLTLRAQQANANGDTIYLYEISHPNLATYSPVRTVKSMDASEAVALMAGGSIPLEDVAVVHEDNFPALTRAASGTLNFEKGGFRIRGESDGTSLLVVPVQFSNSLRITATQADSKNAPIRLLRVNLLETGILFDGTIDVKIAHVFGPFRGVAGRLQDVEDCRRLGVKETGEIPYPPGYQPLAWKSRH